MAKLSIVTINLNNSSGLRQTIESVLGQTFNDYQFIIIDGSSKDESVEVIKEFENKISFWRSEPDKGIYNAMNKGIVHSSGEYCLFLNSGDKLLHKDVLKNCFDITFSEDFVYGHQVIEKDGVLVEDPCLDTEYITFLTLSKSHICHQCTFIKRELFNRIGFYNEENKIISDWEFVMTGLFIYSCSIRRIPTKMTIYNTSGISSQEVLKRQQFEERRKFLEKQFPLFLPDYDSFERFMNKNYIKGILSVRSFFKHILRLIRFRSY
jgi:glycosyltransferase involved in cell wall biosynthesis